MPVQIVTAKDLSMAELAQLLRVELSAEPRLDYAWLAEQMLNREESYDAV